MVYIHESEDDKHYNNCWKSVQLVKTKLALRNYESMVNKKHELVEVKH